MAELGGLPSSRLPPLPLPQDSWRFSYSNQAGPPTPQSASSGMMDGLPPAMAALHAAMAAKQQEVEGYNALIQDRNWHIDDYRKCKENLATTVQNIAILENEAKAKIHQEISLRTEAESGKAELEIRAYGLQQDKESLVTRVTLLQAQVAALEEEKTGLGRELESEESQWETEKQSLVTEKGEVQEALAGQRSERIRLQEANDKLQEDLLTSSTKLDKIEGEKRDLQERLKDARGEMESLRTDHAESGREIDRLKSKVTSSNRHGQTIEIANHSLEAEKDRLSGENEAQAKDVKTLKDRCDELDGKVSTAAALQSQFNQLIIDLKSSRDQNVDMQDGQARLQRRLNDAIGDKEKMSEKMNKAQTDTAAAKKALTETVKARDSLKSKVNKLDQQCYTTGHERDNAQAANKRLESQWTKMKEAADQAWGDIEELKKERAAANAAKQEREGEIAGLKETEGHLREQLQRLGLELQKEKTYSEKLGNHIAAGQELTNSSKKAVSAKVEEDRPKAGVDQAEGGKADCAQPATPSRPPSQRLSRPAADPAPAGHITPPPDNVDVEGETRKQPGAELPASEATRPTTSIADTYSSAGESIAQSAPKISFSLARQTSPKASSPKNPSPLNKTTGESVTAGDGLSISATAREIGGKRKRDEGHSSDPRPAKQHSNHDTGRSSDGHDRGGRKGGYGQRRRGPSMYDRRW